MKNRFPDQTHLPALSESKVRHQKPERTSVQTHSDFTDLQVRGPFAHQILVRRDTPIRHSNRENFSYALLIVRQLVSKTLSPWYGLSNLKEKAIFSPWILTGIHAPNTMTIMYGPYRHRRHVAHSLTPVLTSKLVPGFYAILYTFYTLRGKVRRPPDLHQWTLLALRNKWYREK